jgi:hypothetical protein
LERSLREEEICGDIQILLAVARPFAPDPVSRFQKIPEVIAALSAICSTCRIVRRYQGGEPGDGQAEPSPVVLGLEEIRFHARIGPRLLDRIHNTIALRLFPLGRTAKGWSPLFLR